VTKIWCDADECQSVIQWPFFMPQAQAEQTVRRLGWRKDKLGRNLCPAHPKLKGARR
jgi:hypothetical protein